MINEITEKAAECGINLYSVAVIDGEGLHKAKVQKANRCNNSYSVAKAFTMTAIGMLWDKGLISTEDKIHDIFKDEFPENYDPKWKTVTVDQALRHSIGFDSGFLDIDVEKISDYGTDDFLSIVLSRPLPYEPGEKWVYSDAAFYLLSRVVSKISGQKLDDFMRPVLFGTLGFQELAWSVCPKGYPMGATGLYISSADMAKLGYAYACGGEYNGKTVVSSDWVDTALSRGYEFGQYKDTKVYAKGGMCGQMLCFSTKKRVSCAWHGFETEKDGGILLKQFVNSLEEKYN